MKIKEFYITYLIWMLWMFQSVEIRAQEIDIKREEFRAESAIAPIQLSRENQDQLAIDWIRPYTRQLSFSETYLPIELMIFSSKPVQQRDITVLLNGRNIGARAGETALLGGKQQFRFQDRIHLADGHNTIQVVVDAGNFTKRSSLLKVYKNPNNPTSSNLENLRVFWLDPDPLSLDGKPKLQRQNELKISLRVFARRSLDLTNVHIIVNDKRQSHSNRAQMPGQNGQYNFTDYINLGENAGIFSVVLEVQNENGISRSEPLIIDYSPWRPNLYILSIAPRLNLAYTEKDARDFASLFANQGGKAGNRLFNSINVKTLLGEEATVGEIRGQLEELKGKLKQGRLDTSDVVILFLSSHGFMLNGDFRIQGNDFELDREESSSVSYKKDILNFLDRLPCKKLIFIDACQSGGARADMSRIIKAIRELNQRSGLTTIASSRESEASYEDPVWQNGAFTRGIIHGLGYGLADQDKDQIITINELFEFLSRTVPAMVKKIKNKNQHPTIVNDELGNVAIYVINR